MPGFKAQIVKDAPLGFIIVTKSLTIPVFSYKAFEANSFGDFSLGNGPLTALSPLKVLGVITGGTSGMAGNFLPSTKLGVFCLTGGVGFEPSFKGSLSLNLP